MSNYGADVQREQRRQAARKLLRLNAGVLKALRNASRQRATAEPSATERQLAALAHAHLQQAAALFSPKELLPRTGHGRALRLVQAAHALGLVPFPEDLPPAPPPAMSLAAAQAILASGSQSQLGPKPGVSPPAMAQPRLQLPPQHTASPAPAASNNVNGTPLGHRGLPGAASAQLCSSARLPGLAAQAAQVPWAAGGGGGGGGNSLLISVAGSAPSGPSSISSRTTDVARPLPP